MSDFVANFNVLEENIKNLIEAKKKQQQVLEQSREENEKLAARLVSMEKEIEDLNEKNKILRIAGGAKTGSGREIKLKINEIVREVDKCIAQLNQ